MKFGRTGFIAGMLMQQHKRQLHKRRLQQLCVDSHLEDQQSMAWGYSVLFCKMWKA